MIATCFVKPHSRGTHPRRALEEALGIAMVPPRAGADAHGHSSATQTDVPAAELIADSNGFYNDDEFTVVHLDYIKIGGCLK